MIIKTCLNGHCSFAKVTKTIFFLQRSLCLQWSLYTYKVIKAVADEDECKIIVTKAQCDNQNQKKAAVSTNGYQNTCISIKLNHDGCTHTNRQ